MIDPHIANTTDASGNMNNCLTAPSATHVSKQHTKTSSPASTPKLQSPTPTKSAEAVLIEQTSPPPIVVVEPPIVVVSPLTPPTVSDVFITTVITMTAVSEVVTTSTIRDLVNESDSTPDTAATPEVVELSFEPALSPTAPESLKVEKTTSAPPAPASAAAVVRENKLTVRSPGASQPTITQPPTEGCCCIIA